MSGRYLALIPAAYGLLIGLEFLLCWLAARRGHGPLGYSVAGTVTNLSCGIGSQIFAAIGTLQGVFVYQWVATRHALLRPWPTTFAQWLLGLLLVDLCWYFSHRASHRVRLLWTIHSVHHQSEEFNLTVALRVGWLSGVFAWPFFLPLALLGVPLLSYLALRTLHDLIQFVQHTRCIGRLGALEWVFNTPSHHRVHHGCEAPYLNKNYAGIFIVWDRLFGTFQQEEEEPTYGSVTPLRTPNPLWVNLAEWLHTAQLVVAATRWRDKLWVLLMPPEWCPHGALLAQTDSQSDAAPRPIDSSTMLYIGVHFLLLVAAWTVFSMGADKLSAWLFALWTFELITPMVVLGSLLEHRRFGLWLEVLRLASIGVIAVFVLRPAGGLGPLSWSGLVLLGLLGNLFWLSQLPLARPDEGHAIFRLRTLTETRWDRGCAVLIFVTLILYAVRKYHEQILGELLYGCQVSALITGIGLYFHRRFLVGLGLVFASGMGIPMWLILVATTGTTHVLSVILHVLPPCAAAVYVKRHGLPRHAWLGALLMFTILLPISHYGTDPALNVNLSHRPTVELMYFVPWFWGAWLYGAIMTIALLFTADFVLRRTLCAARKFRGIIPQ